MFIVLGIGNPDEKYADTRHNVGWMTVDALSETIGKKFKKAGFEFWAAEGRLGRHEVALVKTWTYVNETGRAIPELRKRWGEELIVVCDDVNLPLGSLRIRKDGSSGGHNGLKSVEAALGANAYPRMRLGVGGGKPDPNWVLGKFTKDEKPAVLKMVAEACDALRCWMDEGIELAMTKFNRRPPSAEEGQPPKEK
jgi:PTH1 family peptidyl-tRNA hydrolase